MIGANKFFLHLLIFVALVSVLSCQPAKTKNAVDRIYELDPAGKIYVSPTLKKRPPKTVAVLPFHSLVGNGRVEGSRFLFDSFSGKNPEAPQALEESMRRAFFGQFAQLEFDHVKLSRVDRVLKRKIWVRGRKLLPFLPDVWVSF
jgi:hypothetical protein